MCTALFCLDDPRRGLAKQTDLQPNAECSICRHIKNIKQKSADLSIVHYLDTVATHDLSPIDQIRPIELEEIIRLIHG